MGKLLLCTVKLELSNVAVCFESENEHFPTYRVVFLVINGNRNGSHQLVTLKTALLPLKLLRKQTNKYSEYLFK